jgi:hypothetical protein
MDVHPTKNVSIGIAPYPYGYYYTPIKSYWIALNPMNFLHKSRRLSRSPSPATAYLPHLIPPLSCPGRALGWLWLTPWRIQPTRESQLRFNNKHAGHGQYLVKKPPSHQFFEECIIVFQAPAQFQKNKDVSTKPLSINLNFGCNSCGFCTTESWPTGSSGFFCIFLTILFCDHHAVSSF